MGELLDTNKFKIVGQSITYKYTSPSQIIMFEHRPGATRMKVCIGHPGYDDCFIHGDPQDFKILSEAFAEIVSILERSTQCYTKTS